MKKLLCVLAFIMMLTLALASCGASASETNEPAQTAAETKKSVIKHEDATQTTQTEAPEQTKVPDHEIDINDPKLTFVQEFPAPEAKTGDDLRQIVLNKMKEESEIEWVAAEDFHTGWKPGEEGDFGVDLDYKKGTTYKGITYTDKASTLDQFQQYLKDGKFKSDSYYYRECVGNNCSTAIVVAYNEIIDFPGSGGFRPNTSRYGVLDYPIELQLPDTTPYYSEDIHKLNGQEKIFEAYAALGAGDMLYKNIDGSGHVRLVDHVELSTNFSGEVNYARSQVVCMEQTNAWDKERPGVNSTWYVGHKYGFSTLFQTNFTPVTLCIFHEENPVLKTAYITFNGTNTPESVLEGFQGTVESNFVLNYVRMSLTDKDGNIVSCVNKFLRNNSYSYNIRKDQYEVFNGVPAGTYTFTLRAGIGRGGCDIEKFEVTVK